MAERVPEMVSLAALPMAGTQPHAQSVRTRARTALQSRAGRMSPAGVFIGLVFRDPQWGVWRLFLGPVLIVQTKGVADRSRSARPPARLMAA